MTPMRLEPTALGLKPSTLQVSHFAPRLGGCTTGRTYQLALLFNVFLLSWSCWCSVYIPHDAVGWSAVPGPEVIKLFFILNSAERENYPANKCYNTVGILTFISMINTTSERLKARNFFICQYFSFYEQLKFHAQLS